MKHGGKAHYGKKK